MFYQKLLAARIYINKNIVKAKQRFRGPVEANPPRSYTSVSMITKKRFTNWLDKVVNTMEYAKQSIIIIVL